MKQRRIETFENLTYDDLENIKRIAMENSILEKYLCDSKNEFVTDISKEIKTLITKFSNDQYNAIKEVLQNNRHFKWFFCSSLYISAVSKRGTKFTDNGTIWWTASPPSLPASESYRLVKNTLSQSNAPILQPKKPITFESSQILNLRMCQNVADMSDVFHSSICGCRKGKY